MNRQRRQSSAKTPGPFARVAVAATFDPGVSAAAIRVLAAVASYADANGFCFPSVSTVAERLGLERRTVQRHLRTLEAGGYVESQRTRRSRGGFGANLYRLKFPASDATSGVASARTHDATPGTATHATPHVASSDATPHVALTRPSNKTIGTRAHADTRDGNEWNVLRERLTALHGFSHATACEVAATACLQAGGSAKLDALMATAEASGTSAHDRIMTEFAGALAA